jgi:hypothetical protein
MNRASRLAIGVIMLALPACGSEDDLSSLEPSSVGEEAEALTSLSPRVTCGGFNGNVTTGGRQLHIWGLLWDTCGSGTYSQLFLNWCVYNPLQICKNGIKIATAGPHSTVGVNYTNVTTLVTSGSLTVCAHYKNGWHCGAGKSFQ